MNELVAARLRTPHADRGPALYPVQVELLNDDGPYTRLRIVDQDNAGRFRGRGTTYPLSHARWKEPPRIHFVAPLAYLDLLRVMARCFLILTDSGGIQEVAPSFRKPVLILRRRTERPELVEPGGRALVGMDADRIVQEAGRLLTDPGAYRRMQLGENPFGDGRAAQKIVAVLADRLRR